MSREFEIKINLINKLVQIFCIKPFMLEIKRKTILNSISINGIGLHSGKKVNLKLHPAESGAGISFVYYENNSTERSVVPVALDHVIDTSNAVTLGDGRHIIQTVEHLMAALYTLGITDLILEIDSIEMPSLDGSALEFVKAINSAGIYEFEETLEPITIMTPAWVVDGDKYIVVLPSEEMKVTYHIDFNHPLLKGQSHSTPINQTILLNEILPARTFGFIKDVEAMQAKGLALGASLENAVVLTETGYLNESLRFENECVRHKILDLIGDLSIMGRPLIGHILASKAGHALDISLGKYIMSKVSGDELSKFKSKRIPLFKKKLSA